MFKMICFCGFSYQLQNIMMSYFKFGTITRTQIVMPEVIGVPALHYCFPCLQDLIDIPAIEAKYKIRAGNTATPEVFKIMDQITIGDMFEFTPNDPIQDCMLRDQAGNRIIEGSKQICNTVFNTTKYIIQQYVCYKSVPIRKDNFLFGLVVSSLDAERMIYEIKLKRMFNKVRKVRAIITNWKFPVLEHVYAPSFYKPSNQVRGFQMSCNNITARWLGYPYDKFICQKKGEIDYYQCRDTCLEQKMFAKYRRMPFTSFYPNSFEKSTLKLVSSTMLEDPSISRQMYNWWKECHNNCPTFPCSYSYCSTAGYSSKPDFAYSGSNIGSTITVETSTHPNSFMTAFPQVPLLDFVIYVLSSLGTWFGFVIISCNPINLMKSKEPGKDETVEMRNPGRFETNRRRNLARARFSQYHHN